MSADRRESLAKVKKIVVKIGSSLLTGDRSRGVRTRFLSKIAGQVGRLQARGMEVSIVTSGAIAAGLFELKLKTRPKDIPRLQALAAIGQSNLMQAYGNTFKKNGIKVAQVLLTREDLSNRHRYSNARNTFVELFRNKIVPVVNENDTVAVEEIKFGDNDTLAVLVTHLAEADLLILLTDTDGFYEMDPRLNPKAKIISDIRKWDEDFTRKATASQTLVGTGGMKTKIQAAKSMMRSGIPMAIVNGNGKDILTRLLAGENVGSYFYPTSGRMGSRDRWLTWSVKPKGEVTIDEGAQRALLEKNKSLLPSGVRAVSGNWVSGDVVKIVDGSQRELARGVANYSSQELERIKGFRTEEVFKTLGYQVRDEVVHRDNMVKTGDEA